MKDLTGIVRVLKAEQDRLTRELRGIAAALAAFGTVYTQGRPKRKLSTAGRARIVAAQKERWAKLRENRKAQQKVVPIRRKRTLSAAARKKIAAAQKARWAKVKAAKKTA